MSKSFNVSMFSSDLVIRKYQYQMYIVENGSYSWEEVVEMDMRALRMAVDELLPLMITQTYTTISGGKSKKVTVVKSA